MKLLTYFFETIITHLFTETLMKELGHENRVLDYLKVDTDRGDGTGFEDTVKFILYTYCVEKKLYHVKSKSLKVGL